MALVALTFKKRRTSIDSLALDATVSELHTIETEITEHPVELGADITDHRRRKPDAIQIEGVISNTPIPHATDPLTRKTFNNVTYDSRGQIDRTRAPKALQTLIDLNEDGQLVDVFTRIRQYENMALKTLTVPQDKRTAEAIRFTAILVEVRIVSNKEENVDDKGKGKTDTGKKTATVASDTEVRRSTLKQLSNTKPVDGFLKKIGAR